MMEKNKIKDIVSTLTEQVMSKIKQEETPKIQSGIDPKPYIKLIQVKNGFILENNSDDITESPETEVIEIEDMSDPESITGILYGVAEWLGIEYNPKSSKNLNITFDAKGENFDKNAPEPPSPLESQKITEEDVKKDRYYIEDQFPKQPKEDLKPKQEDVNNKPPEITKEMVIRAAMGLPPENTVREEDVAGYKKKESQFDNLEVEEDQYQVDRDNLKENEYVEGDESGEEPDPADSYGDQKWVDQDLDNKLDEQDAIDLENLPDGDFDEDGY